MKKIATMLKELFEKWLRPQWTANVSLGNSDIPKPVGSPYKLPKDYPAPRDSLRRISHEQQTSVSFEAAGDTASIMPSRC